MYNFNFYMPTKVLFGPGKLNELHSEQLPGKKALIAIGGKSVKKYGYLERLEKELDAANVKYVLFEGIRPNPTDINVMEGAKAVRENDCDFVIALGGGSIMDVQNALPSWHPITEISGITHYQQTVEKNSLKIRHFLLYALQHLPELQVKLILLP